jgi:hypothetical protein
MTTKKAAKSTKRDASRGGDPLEAMRATLAQAEREDNAELCRRVDEYFNDEIRRACAQKLFEQTFGNCKIKQCQTVAEPKIVPCLRLRWGDGAKDQLETEDTEVLCITVCNPYANVAFNNFTMQLIVRDANGNLVPNLPDGTPSVLIKPSYMICFDDIPPCDPRNPGQSCVSREVVLITRGAIVGPYRIFVLYCFQACFTQLRIEAAFTLDLVAS